MKKVIITDGYGTYEGFADQITLPNGKYFYTGSGSINSQIAKEKGLEIKTVRYFGASISSNINYFAHRNFPIQIDEVSVADFIDKIATEEECSHFSE